jgi:opacity protein-like surface antigen
MRCGVAAVLAFGVGLGLASSASAADYGPLRGSTFDAPRYRNWEGFYVGGQVGSGGGGANFTKESQAVSGSAIVNTWLASEGVGSWATAERADTGQAIQYGAFIGYNFQWDDVVLGLEASYNHTDLNANSYGRSPVSGRMWLTDPSGWNHSVLAQAEGDITLTDLATVRARAGYAFGAFLPYVTGGLALGRASWWTRTRVDYPNSVASTSSITTADPGSWDSGWVTDGKSNSLIYGWSAGIGMDVALTQNIFLRGEYEYIQFSQSKLNLNNVRGGLGIKF